MLTVQRSESFFYDIITLRQSYQELEMRLENRIFYKEYALEPRKDEFDDVPEGDIRDNIKEIM